MTHRIAVASSNGKTIDLHFGQAYLFYIYDIYEDHFERVEERKAVSVIAHEPAGFSTILALLKDCEAIVVSKIGVGAVRQLTGTSIRVFEAPYPVEDVLNKLVSKQILFKG